MVTSYKQSCFVFVHCGISVLGKPQLWFQIASCFCHPLTQLKELGGEIQLGINKLWTCLSFNSSIEWVFKISPAAYIWPAEPCYLASGATCGSQEFIHAVCTGLVPCTVHSAFAGLVWGICCLQFLCGAGLQTQSGLLESTMPFIQPCAIHSLV